ncbi:MAG TPA: hypothetical protein VGD37_22940, partial [Kofleriaceae bacterium]
MALLQLLAARLAGVDRVRFYAADRHGQDDLRAAVADLAQVHGSAGSGGPGGAPATDAVLERVAGLGYEWGVSDGN